MSTSINLVKALQFGMAKTKELNIHSTEMFWKHFRFFRLFSVGELIGKKTLTDSISPKQSLAMRSFHGKGQDHLAHM